MPFVEDILQHRSVSIVGLEKNTGKTTCLNYVLKRLSTMDSLVAITSIGVDGEQTDRVTHTPKPEVVVYEGMIFVTSEKHYRKRRLVAEVLDVSDESTSLGRLVTARAITTGKVMLSGPAHNDGIKRLIQRMAQWGVQTTIVDGALSRLSLASPAVSESLILATGAAVSANIPMLVRKTQFVQRLIDVDVVSDELAEQLKPITSGLWAIDSANQLHDLEITSAFMLDKNDQDLLRFGTRIFVAGAVSTKLLDYFRLQHQAVELIFRDFTVCFASPESLSAYLQGGNQLKSLYKTKLLAVTVNPLSPNGMFLDSDRLQSAMRDALHIPVYDIMTLDSTH